MVRKRWKQRVRDEASRSSSVISGVVSNLGESTQVENHSTDLLYSPFGVHSPPRGEWRSKNYGMKPLGYPESSVEWFSTWIDSPLVGNHSTDYPG